MPWASQRRVAEYLAPLTSAIANFGINTPAHQASFLAQVGHGARQLSSCASWPVVAPTIPARSPRASATRRRRTETASTTRGGERRAKAELRAGIDTRNRAIVQRYEQAKPA